MAYILLPIASDDTILYKCHLIYHIQKADMLTWIQSTDFIWISSVFTRTRVHARVCVYGGGVYI